MLDHLDNPAGRIVAALQRAEKHLHEKVSARDGWLQVFEANDVSQLPARIADFITQVQLTKDLVESLPESESPEHLSKYFGSLDQIVSYLLSVGSINMPQFGNFIKPELIFSLESCSLAIRRHVRLEPTIDTEGLTKIVDTIRQVCDDIADSDIPEDAKLPLIRRLRDVEDAVLSFKVAGYSGIEATLDALVGRTLWRTPPEVKEKSIGWVKRVVSAIGSFTKGAATLAGSTQTVVESYKAITGE